MPYRYCPYIFILNRIEKTIGLYNDYTKRKDLIKINAIFPLSFTGSEKLTERRTCPPIRCSD
jgi:hypothetical protein